MKPVLLTAVVFLVLSLMWKTVLKIEASCTAHKSLSSGHGQGWQGKYEDGRGCIGAYELAGEV